MSNNNANNANNNGNIIARTIEELNEIRSRSERNDQMLSQAFFKAVLLYIRYEKETLLQAVLATCERLRIAHVKETLSWSTNNAVTFQKIETLLIPILTDREGALYAFVGHKKAHKSLFTLIQEYLAYRKNEREKVRKIALTALKQADLLTAARATEQAIKAVEKKFPQHGQFFATLKRALWEYKG